MIEIQDISPDWKGSTIAEQAALAHILQHEGTPLAIVKFEKYKHVLDDYWYWFTLSTLWVSYSGYSDLKLWRRLFQAARSKRQTSIMKPSEWESFKTLPNSITAYRAHRPDETDWISYTIDEELAERWAEQRGGYVRPYTINKLHCLAFFLRRGESEILMLQPKRAKLREEG